MLGPSGTFGDVRYWKQKFVKEKSMETTLPETNGLHLKMVVSNRNFLFQGSIFRCHVSFREGKMEPKHGGWENNMFRIEKFGDFKVFTS